MTKAILVVLAAWLSVYAQNCGDTISLKGNWFIGYKYSYRCSDYQKIAGFFSLKKELRDILSTNLAAQKEMSAALTWGGFGTVLGCIGGAIIGWNLADVTYGKKVENRVWYIALGFIGVGITFDIIGTRRMLQSVRTFNAGASTPENAR